MPWNSFVSHLATASRRRAVATAVVYGLSLSVRFASGVGEATETPGPVAQGTDSMTSIMISNGAPIFHRDGSYPLAVHRDCASPPIAMRLPSLGSIGGGTRSSQKPRPQE
jgi:hypothetical protein